MLMDAGRRKACARSTSSSCMIFPQRALRTRALLPGRLAATEKCRRSIRFHENSGPSLSGFAFIGDSITDAAALRYTDSCGGLAVAFNGNGYAIEAATLGVASTK